MWCQSGWLIFVFNLQNVGIYCILQISLEQHVLPDRTNSVADLHISDACKTMCVNICNVLSNT